MIAQMVGIISAQFILTLADPAGYTLFVVMSVLVSLCFTPILLSAGTAPPYQTTKPMTLVQLFRISPLGCVGTFLLGGVYAGIFGMASVFGTEMKLTRARRSRPSSPRSTWAGSSSSIRSAGSRTAWTAARLITGLTAGGALLTLLGGIFSAHYTVVLVLGFVVGGVANPLYSLIIAYTNDFLDKSDMAAASGGLLFINGLGAITGPLIIGAAMTRFGPNAFFAYIGTLFALIALYALWRATAPRRAGRDLLLCAGHAAGLAGGARGGAGSGDRARRRRLSRFPFYFGSVRLPAHEEATMDPTAREVLDYWLGLGPEAWYRGGEALDEEIRGRWGAVWEKGRTGALDGWRCAPDSSLALIIVLDQFPRNMFRDDARAFSTDARALAVAKTSVLHGIGPARAAARAPVLLYPAPAFGGPVQPGPGGAAVPLELRPGRDGPRTRGRIARSSAASAASPSATPRSGARARRRRWPSSPRAATGP